MAQPKPSAKTNSRMMTDLCLGKSTNVPPTLSRLDDRRKGGAAKRSLGGRSKQPPTSFVTFRDCEFINNLADFGGGLFAEGSTVVICGVDSLLTGNSAQTTCENDGTNAEGGAVWFRDMASGTSITDTEFSGHNNSDHGGAVAVRDSSNTITIDHCEFTGDESDCPAGTYP